MRCVIQRVLRASVSVNGETVSSIGRGLLIFAAVEKGDDEQAMERAARKIREMRIFGDDSGKMNLDVSQAAGAILAVSQFTLAGSLERGRRPSFERAEEPDLACALFDRFVILLGESGTEVRTGRFRQSMIVTLENDGPVTFVL